MSSAPSTPGPGTAPDGSGVQGLPVPPPPAGDAGSATGSALPGGEAPTTTPAAAATQRTRASGAYLSVAVCLVILVVVLDFIIQNLDEATVHFFSARFRLPIGILVLGGAVGGGIIVLLVSLFRVVQLRRTNRRQRRVT